MHTIMKSHNRPAATLIKEYCNKKSGKVSDARRELHRRFEHLDWSQQKKIMMAHLQSCSSDRNWAYTQLLSLWDESFIPIVEELWLTYHEERCSWIIVNHFPDDYLTAHLEELSQGRNYYFICRRLGQNEQFPIDASRLQPLDHLSLMANLGRDISAATALEQIFKIVKKECLSPHYFMPFRQWLDTRHVKPSPLHVRALDRAFYYLQALPDREALEQFSAWCDLVSDDLQHSDAFQSLLKEPISDDDFNQQVYHLLLEYMAKHLPAEIRNAYLLEMTERNSALEQLVGALDLEEDLTPPPPNTSCPF